MNLYYVKSWITYRGLRGRQKGLLHNEEGTSKFFFDFKSAESEYKRSCDQIEFLLQSGIFSGKKIEVATVKMTQVDIKASGEVIPIGKIIKEVNLLKEK